MWRPFSARYGISKSEKVREAVLSCEDVLHYVPDSVMSESIAHVSSRRWLRQRVFVARCRGEDVEPLPEWWFVPYADDAEAGMRTRDAMVERYLRDVPQQYRV